MNKEFLLTRHSKQSLLILREIGMVSFPTWKLSNVGAWSWQLPWMGIGIRRRPLPLSASPSVFNVVKARDAGTVEQLAGDGPRAHEPKSMSP